LKKSTISRWISNRRSRR